ncbi:ABC transporter permease subunit [Spirobacillus cienkowskii]|jgi:microcin C transport system permease protein|uniref:ABC transporter permease subunit n=1 Tax=Spirobacillus cienkowskii TaxID=495820 RepID=A0A369KKP8_9BACT|nr:MAG: ABC transporter permease subunit [Spirobacillus cienkowskii]
MKNKRKLELFFLQKKTKFGLIIFLILFICALFAEIISNNKPIIFIKEKHIYFPSFIEYTPNDFKLQDVFVVDYKQLEKAEKAHGHFVFSIYPFFQWNAEEQTAFILMPPSSLHVLGTDNLGRDILARLLYGTRISLSFAIILWLLSYSIGTIIGAVQGYFVGSVDFLLERFKELAAIIPMLTLVVLITAITKNQSFWIILGLVLIFGWMGIASQIRANVLTLRRRDFCEASIALGGSHFRILWKHILPNALTPIITLSPFAIESGISLLAALDYLGFGLPPPTPSLGELMAQGRDNIQNAPWVLISPVVTILLLLISISLIGQALRATFDPRSA